MEPPLGARAADAPALNLALSLSPHAEKHVVTVTSKADVKVNWVNTCKTPSAQHTARSKGLGITG